MVKQIFIFFFALATTGILNAQVNLLNAKKVEEIGVESEAHKAANNDGPIPYGYVDDRDVLWSKVVWELIDLNQKINLPYYFPVIKTNVSADRKSLFDTLIDGVNEGKLEEVYSDSFFTSKMTKDMLDERLRTISDDKLDTIRVNSLEISAYKIKGLWYFDKRQGELKYRLIGIAPMSQDLQAIAGLIEDDTLYELFWVFYPGARQVLHDSKVFNPKNSSHPISYDHLLNARRFSAIIVKEENVYDNRAISDYVRGNSLFQLLEADKIKEDIRNKEIDMWSY